MIVKSATGDVDLSVPENVRRGMLFRGNGRDFVAACDSQFSFLDGAPYTFLGCHPEIARREDCERFGIPLRCEQHGVPDAPIDAGAHGFARTREGFAVDLRRECPTGARPAAHGGRREGRVMADKTTDRCACDALGRGAPGLHTRDCRTRTVLGMLLQDRIRPEPHMELRGLEAPVKALAFAHLVKGFAEHDHARFVELTGGADDSGAEKAPVAHPTEEDP